MIGGRGAFARLWAGQTASVFGTSVSAFRWQADGLLTFRNPSGHTPEAVAATLPVPVFDRFAAHRGIALHL